LQTLIAMNLEQARFNMIEQQIRPWNVLDTTVLDLLGVVKREDFVPAAHRNLAFMDIEVPLAGGQHMLAPRVAARLLQEAAPMRHEKVLEIGTGSGFLTALLAHKAQQVLSLEIRPELAAQARENLRHANIMNAEVRQGDGVRGDAAHSPWDLIVLTGSVAEVPKHLLAQLKVGGRLIAVVGQLPVMRAVRVSCKSESTYDSVDLFDLVTDRLEGFGEPSRFNF
jgi:protein-L-isoaspartate(D-aspartate) O-methyltransferase